MAGEHTSRARAGWKQKEGVVPAAEALCCLCEPNTSSAPLVLWAEGGPPSLPIICQQEEVTPDWQLGQGEAGLSGTYPGGGGAHPLVHGACGRRGSKRRASAAS